jgi:hypothetical protein
MQSTLLKMLFLVVVSLSVGCQAWKMDYGQPAAQFLEADVATAGKPYLGKKVTIQGTVTRVDVSDPKAGWIHLGNGIRCDFSRLPAMASSKKPGDICFIDGILKECEEGNILLDSAMLRDPTAPFTPHR